MTIRVLGYVGAPTADVRVGWVGADRIVSDGTTEIRRTVLDLDAPTVPQRIRRRVRGRTCER